MGQLQDYFQLQTSSDQMIAEIHPTETYFEGEETIEFDESEILQFINDNKITHGILLEHVRLLTEELSENAFPVRIAEGTEVENGKDGSVIYEYNFDAKVDKTEDWNFRDVMRIPSVKTGQRLAKVIPPTEGVNGKNVYGNEVPSKPGKPTSMKARKNVVFQEESMAFYTATDGQVSINGDYIDVYEVFEVSDTLSMKEGNLDFVGSIVINGDVPSGFTVKAGGDVKVFGMVENAQVIAGASIFVSEGLAGHQTGSLNAGENIHIGYLNQGIVTCGNDLYVENSILHSTCTVGKQAYCQRGNIIGGSISAGELVEAKEIGNKLYIKTEILFGLNKIQSEKEQQLVQEKEDLQANLSKLKLIGDKLKASNNVLTDPKLKAAWLRQQHSYEQASERLEEVENHLLNINASLGNEKRAKLVVHGHLYPNVIVSFGKYQKAIKREFQHIRMKMDKNEISILNL
ncbi:hypothetical protein SAMN05216389_10267 [Oceanobacillus limi]|uniref:Flagellar Assembly Protein A N-terminal region domain-containing protein n=1 Tax=Oceanobacillus limi TaxID=930131 RepID=A0A1H9Z2T5_9BACI|nr:FapA family protein [Oceanobacillus limi]SES75805.1 hypothetical protein SAMN05216389_10267 [Oceanobacillus limi]